MVVLQLWVTLPPEARAAVLASSADHSAAAVPQPIRGAGTSSSASVPAAPARIASHRTRPAGVVPAPTVQGLPENPGPDDFYRSAVLPEPLVPVGRVPTADENKSLARALETYRARKDAEDVSALRAFVDASPGSPWRVAVLVNLGILHYQACRFSETFPAWEEAWRLGREATEQRAKALSDRAIGELAAMHARVGRMDRLESLLTEVGARSLVGAGSELMAGARSGLHRMKNEPWVSFRCGPLALDRLQAAADPSHALGEAIYYSRSTTNGFSLTQVRDLSRKTGQNLLMARRAPGAPLLLPAVVNWKVGHYAALVGEDAGRIHVQDPTFGTDLWISRATLDQEASGYFLVSSNTLPHGWSEVDGAEGDRVFGKGNMNDPPLGEPQTPPPPPPTCGGGNASVGGMVRYAFEPVTVSLSLTDTPVGYAPPRGPAVRFSVSYLHRAGSQPANFDYANLGPKWTFDWISFVRDNPSNPSAEVSVFLPGGGSDFFSGFNPATATFATHIRKRTVLSRTSATSYSLLYPDGSRHEFAWPVGTAPARRVFLSRVVDPQGNGVDLLYDASNRLVGLQDSLGQMTTLDYGNPADIYKVTKVTDPFGRFAQFQYDANGRLTNIVDVIGIASGMAYKGGTDFVEALTTPYGTSRFRAGIDGAFPWLELTDPEGATERVEFRHEARGIPFTDGAGVPQTMQAFNQYIWSRNTFHWDKKQFREAAGDYTKARIYHWLHGINPGSYSSILESEKQPLENRVWYNYPGQTWPGGENAGMLGKPSKVGRILDDGSTQLSVYEYNDLGYVTKRTDPVGRTTEYIYASNRVDLVQVRQTAGVNDVLENRTYNAQHQPLTIDDGCGHTNRFTYNVQGQITAMTDPAGYTTQFQYNEDGYLVATDGPLPGSADSVSFTYDGFGRMKTVTRSDGYTVTYEFDALNRLVRKGFPDGSYDEENYERLDRISHRDRNGRSTRYGFDANQRLVSVKDPLDRVTRYEWCDCGGMSALVDPAGKTTSWRMDLQGRIVSKEYADGSQIRYDYEATTSRLKSVTGGRGQVKLFSYWTDDNIRSVDYLNAEHPTPRVTFSYDSPYNRIKSMEDGTGTTVYSYHPGGVQGRRLAAVDGPLQNDTLTYEYDGLGRVVRRTIDGVVERWEFDALGRVTGATNLLGAFGRDYDGASSRPTLMTYPNGQTTRYRYLDAAGDFRLREIHHLSPGSQTVSRFEYDYDASGQITRWLQQLGVGPAETWMINHDDGNRLRTVSRIVGESSVGSFEYGYDDAGNRVSETRDGVVYRATYNALNQTEDAKGEGMALSWDAEDRLVAIEQGSRRCALSYDGLGRCVRMQDWDGLVSVSDLRFVWSGDELCEIRETSDDTRRIRRFVEGEFGEGGAVYYARDHLGSVRSATDGSGSILAQYGFTPFGERSTVAGAFDTRSGFTGHLRLGWDGLLLTRYRVYSPSQGRWLSRDRLGEVDGDQGLLFPTTALGASSGVNPYLYVRNAPVDLVDPLGLLDGVPSMGRSSTSSRGPEPTTLSGLAAVGIGAGTIGVLAGLGALGSSSLSVTTIVTGMTLFPVGIGLGLLALGGGILIACGLMELFGDGCHLFDPPPPPRCNYVKG